MIIAQTHHHLNPHYLPRPTRQIKRFARAQQRATAEMLSRHPRATLAPLFQRPPPAVDILPISGAALRVPLDGAPETGLRWLHHYPGHHSGQGVQMTSLVASQSFRVKLQ